MINADATIYGTKKEMPGATCLETGRHRPKEDCGEG